MNVQLAFSPPHVEGQARMGPVSPFHENSSDFPSTRFSEGVMFLSHLYVFFFFFLSISILLFFFCVIFSVLIFQREESGARLFSVVLR